jgi:hypothetical protein
MFAGDPTRDHFDPTNSSHTAIQFQCGGEAERASISPFWTSVSLTLQPTRLTCQRVRNVPGSDPRHHSRTAGTVKTHSCPTMAMSLTHLGELTREEYVPKDTYGYQPYSSRVRKSNRPLLIHSAYYKMAESLGPEWKSDEGSLVLYVLPIQMRLRLTCKGQMVIPTALPFTLIGSMVSQLSRSLLIDRLAKWNAGRCIRAM